MSIRRASALLAACLAAASPVEAAVRSSAADGFEVAQAFRIAASPADAWRTLVRPSSYWPSTHTWSGAAANLSLDAKAGGCYCEKWDGGSAEHARVVMVQPAQLLRLHGALGPLQAMGVAGVLTIELKEADAGTSATVTYRVSGDSQHALDQMAPVVDRVLGEQFGRWARLASGETLDEAKTP